jgi:type II secretory pathway pseudopilin PulG
MRTSGLSYLEYLLVFILLLLLIAIALPNLMAQRKLENEAAAMSALRAITSAQAMFREGDLEHDGDLDYGMLSELVSSGVADPDLGSNEKKGYTFEATYSFTTSEYLWFGTARPARPGVTGDRSFASNMAGVIFYGDTPVPLDASSCLLPALDLKPG